MTSASPSLQDACIHASIKLQNVTCCDIICRLVAVDTATIEDGPLVGTSAPESAWAYIYSAII